MSDTFSEKRRSITPSLNGSQITDSCALQDLKAATNMPLAEKSSCAQQQAKLSVRDIEKSVIRTRVIEEYRAYTSKAKHGKIMRAKMEFVTLFNQGKNGPYAELFAKSGKVSRETLDRWVFIVEGKTKSTDGNGESGNPFALVDRRGKHRQGQRCVLPEQAEILVAMALNPNGPLLSEVIRSARARMQFQGITAPQSDKTFRNFLVEFKEKHFDQWIFFREGRKALNEACLPHLERDWEAVQVGDILIADGHIFNFEILNPYTGKPKRMMWVAWYDGRSNYPLGWDISPTENTQSIASSMRRAIVSLGKVPKIAYLDNGRGFRGKFFAGCEDFRQEAFVGIFRSLGVHPIYAWPYHGESKPIERFFGTFAELERRAFSFVGTCIHDKPPRLLRNEKVHRALHAQFTQGKIPTIAEAHHAIAEWIDKEYGLRPQTGHLNGRCPMEVFREGRGPGFTEEQQISLRVLMSQHEVRRIGRDGIRLPGSDVTYYHPDLYGRQLQSAIVRFDWVDGAQIHVYGLNGKFICTAEPRKKVHPAAAYLGTKEDTEELKSRIEEVRGLEKKTIGPAREIFKREILPDLLIQQQNLGLSGVSPYPFEPNKTKQSVTGTPKEAPAESELQATALTAEENVRFQQELAELEQFQGPEDRKQAEDEARLLKILELEARRQDVPIEERAWRSAFERSWHFKARREYFEDVQLKLTLEHMK